MQVSKEKVKTFNGIHYLIKAKSEGNITNASIWHPNSPLPVAYGRYLMGIDRAMKSIWRSYRDERLGL